MKSVFAALVASIVGCALVQPVSGADTARFTERVIHSFGGADGANPVASLTNMNGTLYGTTAAGGGTGCGGSGCGTVFSLDPNTGAEKVVYSFCGEPNCADGAIPQASLLDVNGVLYGTTSSGGVKENGCGATFGCGTVFSLDPNTGTHKVLYSFCQQQNCADGAVPYYSGVIHIKGKLYGTTLAGGHFNETTFGTAYSLDPETGTEKVLYAFCEQTGCADGAQPLASLISVKGVLYGTTDTGGVGVGTVFALKRHSDSETVLYSFGSNKNDGQLPEAGLIIVNGEFYGATAIGGSTGCGGYGCGTVFSIDPNTSTLKTVYSFLGGPDGAEPEADLLKVGATLYGTTYAGGIAGCGSLGCGTAFSIDVNTGAETVRYSFCMHKHCRDGASPNASLTLVNGALYGTTQYGGGPGCGGSGCGAVFVLTTH